MAIIAQENFDSYSNGQELSGLSGGSGWTSTWNSSPTSIFQISNTQADTAANSVTTINVGGSSWRLFGTGRTGSTSFKGKNVYNKYRK